MGLLRELQLEAQERAAQRRDVSEPSLGQGPDRELSAARNAVRPQPSLGYRPPAPEAILPPARGLPYASLRSAHGLAKAAGLKLSNWYRFRGQSTTTPGRNEECALWPLTETTYRGSP